MNVFVRPLGADRGLPTRCGSFVSSGAYCTRSSRGRCTRSTRAPSYFRKGLRRRGGELFEDYTADDIQSFEIFLPRAYREIHRVSAEGVRFAHYTSAEVALKIIRGSSVWMRNAMTMNDFSEIQYGTSCLLEAWNNKEISGPLKEAFQAIFPGSVDEVTTKFNGWLPELATNTYLTCLSEHGVDEDEHGRLSMWRAYGGRCGVALIMKNTPFVAATNALAAYSSPVAYLTPSEFAAELADISLKVAAERELLGRLGRDQADALLFTLFRFAVLCTKHPGFREEMEWRIIYSPRMEPSKTITSSVEVVGGYPQVVQVIPLRNSPEEGLFGAAIPDLLEKVIIGPAENQAALYEAFVVELIGAGVSDAAAKVHISGIPLRN